MQPSIEPAVAGELPFVCVRGCSEPLRVDMAERHQVVAFTQLEQTDTARLVVVVGEVGVGQGRGFGCHRLLQFVVYGHVQSTSSSNRSRTYAP